MRDAITIAKPFKIVLRTVGTLNLIIGVLGVSFSVSSVHAFFIKKLMDQSIPYYGVAFTVMTLTNVAFLLLLLATAVRFIQTRLSAINLYSGAVLALFVYSLIVGEIWRIGARTGSGTFWQITMSVAAATGIGNSGVALFVFLFVVPYLYPLTSIILLQTFRYRYVSPL